MQGVNITEVNRVLNQAGLAQVNEEQSCDAVALIDAFWQQKESIEEISLLRRHHLISDKDIYEYFASSLTDMLLWEEAYEKSPLIRLLAQHKRDASLVLDDPDALFYMTNDVYLSFIQTLIEVGVEIDIDKCFSLVFSGEKQEYGLFSYLLGSFPIGQQALLEAAAWLIHNAYLQQETGRQAFYALIDKGLLVGARITSDYFGDDESLYTVAFAYWPEAFSLISDLAPDKNDIAAMPWQQIAESHYIREPQLEMLKAWVDAGHPVPVIEFAEYLREEDEPEAAELVEGLVR